MQHVDNPSLTAFTGQSSWPKWPEIAKIAKKGQNGDFDWPVKWVRLGLSTICKKTFYPVFLRIFESAISFRPMYTGIPWSATGKRPIFGSNQAQK